MKFTKYLLSILIVIGLMPVSIFAQLTSTAGQDTDFERDQQDLDRPLEEFLESKEDIKIKEKASHLQVSGDVRFEWRHLNEKGYRIYADPYNDRLIQRYMGLRGDDVVDSRGLPVSKNDWDVEFNLKVKYNYDKAWAYGHIQFDNSAGAKGFNDCLGDIRALVLEDEDDTIRLSRYSAETCKGSGEANFVNLKRAYMGYTVWADGVHRFDIELGRRKLDDVFDSEIQFGNRFDGLLLKFTSAIDAVAEWYWYAGVFIIDERVNHVGYVTEIGFLDVFDTSLDIKYSFIDWTKRGHNRCFIRDAVGSEFRTSQFTLTYHLDPVIGCHKIPAELYGAFLINHAARKNIFTHHKKANLGWYLGLYIGEVEKKGDWAIDILYQYVEAQVASDCDVSGIGRGNILDERLTDVIYDPTETFRGNTEIVFNEEESSGVASSYGSFSSYYSGSEAFAVSAILPRRGNTNFKGLKLELLYAITNNLSIDTIYEFTDAADSRIGGKHHYHNFEIEAIYAF